MTLAETLEKKCEEIGRTESKKEIAKRMLTKGFDIHLISEISGLSTEDINNLK